MKIGLIDADIKMRMLRIDGENKKYIGNAVECGMARQLCEALYAACTI